MNALDESLMINNKNEKLASVSRGSKQKE